MPNPEGFHAPVHPV